MAGWRTLVLVLLCARCYRGWSVERTEYASVMANLPRRGLELQEPGASTPEPSALLLLHAAALVRQELPTRAHAHTAAAAAAAARKLKRQG